PLGMGLKTLSYKRDVTSLNDGHVPGRTPEDCGWSLFPSPFILIPNRKFSLPVPPSGIVVVVISPGTVVVVKGVRVVVLLPGIIEVVVPPGIVVVEFEGQQSGPP
ncbi:MAG: hypothetical protein NTZ51_03515, partial [Proteobacteria bacterium]|nr:hypothetical protein [Pseudomonadota bacterium]